jgi:hypothetical protein
MGIVLESNLLLILMAVCRNQTVLLTDYFPKIIFDGRDEATQFTSKRMYGRSRSRKEKVEWLNTVEVRLSPAHVMDNRPLKKKKKKAM